MSSVLRIGSRTSDLAMWQTRRVTALLQAAWPDLVCEVVPFVTKGDKTLDQSLPAIGGKGLFTAELEESLRAGAIDLAVHSLKDLPVANAPGTVLGAISDRADVRDTLVARDGMTLADLPEGARVGTSSIRRQAQLLAVRPDLCVESIRGNVPTRVRKVMDGQYDATLLAAAGLVRLGMDDVISEWLALDVMLPAPGQGALAIQCRADDGATIDYLKPLHDAAAAAAVTAERHFLYALGGGCSAPIAAHATVDNTVDNGLVELVARVGAHDGSKLIEVRGRDADPVALAQRLADDALAAGAQALLADVPA